MAVTTRLYQAADRQAFIDLNRDWIEEYFFLEDSDREQLEELEASILGKVRSDRHCHARRTCCRNRSNPAAAS